MKRKFFIIVLILAMIMAGGCGTDKEKQVTLAVSAAASITDAMNELKVLYEKEKPGVSLTLNYGSSGALCKQIQQGAPADLFISASAKYMNELQQRDLLVNESRKNLLENKIVLIIPVNSTLGITDFRDLTAAAIKKVAIGMPESAPAGKYGQEVLESLGIGESLLPKIVTAKDVRQVLAYVETENVDAGILYRTDAGISDKVKIAAIAPPDSHSPVVYPMAVLKESKNGKEAEEFARFLNSDGAAAVFEKYGFAIATE